MKGYCKISIKARNSLSIFGSPLFIMMFPREEKQFMVLENVGIVCVPTQKTRSFLLTETLSLGTLFLILLFKIFKNHVIFLQH